MEKKYRRKIVNEAKGYFEIILKNKPVCSFGNGIDLKDKLNCYYISPGMAETKEGFEIVRLSVSIFRIMNKEDKKRHDKIKKEFAKQGLVLRNAKPRDVGLFIPKYKITGNAKILKKAFKSNLSNKELLEKFQKKSGFHIELVKNHKH